MLCLCKSREFVEYRKQICKIIDFCCLWDTNDHPFFRCRKSIDSTMRSESMRQPYNGWAVGLSYHGSHKTTKGTALPQKEMSDWEKGG